MEPEFKPNDRVRSLRSGRIWIVADTRMEPPSYLSPDSIPLRKEDWARDNFTWQKKSNFVLEQSSLI